jgi:hypothetical protein
VAALGCQLGVVSWWHHRNRPGHGRKAQHVCTGCKCKGH